MKMYSLLIVLVLAALATGCPRNQYVIEMKPAGSVLERKLTCWREDGTDTNGHPNFQDFPKEELASLTALFPKHETAEDGRKHIFHGEVGDRSPNDVGGQGSYSSFGTSLGTAFSYVERFRGQDDLNAKFERRLKAADQLVDLFIGWSEAELGQHPNFETLRRFLNDAFRKDVKNLSFYGWVRDVSAGDKPEADEELIVRFGQ